MRIHIEQKELLQALKTLAPTVGRDAINVTNGVLFSVSHTEVKLTSSNFETATIAKVDAKIDDIGEMVVNYKLLFDIVNRCTGQIIIEKIGDDLNLFNGEAQYKLSWIAADLFPEVVVDEDLDNKITIERADFEAGIKTVLPFISKTDDSKSPLLKTVKINCANGVLEFVSSDMYRLAKASFEKQGNFSINLNKETIRAILSSNEEEVVLCKGKRKNVVVMEKTTIVTRQYVGNFPDYNSVFNASAEYKAKIDSAVWENALDAVCPLVDNTVTVPVVSTFEGNKLTLAVQSSLGTSKTSCEVSEPFKEKFEVAFNSHYLKEILNNCSDEVEIASNGPHSPFYITEGSKSFVIMPMRHRSIKG